MATVSSLGVGSGLDLSSLLTKLVAAEQQPITLLQQQQSAYQTKISAYGTINSKLSTLLSASQALSNPLGLEAYSATVTDSSVASATTSTGAAPGNYNVHVTNLATAHTLTSSAFTNGTTAVGTGTMRISVGSSSFDVAIDSSNNTLNGIRDAINASSSNTGVSATVVQDSSGARLALTSKNTGAANAISVAVSETGTTGFTSAAGDPANSDNTGLSSLAYVSGAATNLTQAQAAADASLTINGIGITSASNAVSTAITGLTINLNKAGDTTVTVGRDTTAITKLATAFVSAFNDFQSSSRSLSSYDASQKTGGVLNGESAVRSMTSQVTRAAQTVPGTVSGSYKTLADIGISLQKDGTLALDSTKFQAAISNDFASVKSVLTGYASATTTAVTNITGTSGTLTGRISGLNASIKLLGNRADAMTLRLNSFQARYQAQFTALDTTVAQMNATSTYLSQQLAKL